MDNLTNQEIASLIAIIEQNGDCSGATYIYCDNCPMHRYLRLCNPSDNKTTAMRVLNDYANEHIDEMLTEESCEE